MSTNKTKRAKREIEALDEEWRKGNMVGRIEGALYGGILMIGGVIIGLLSNLPA